MNRFGIRTAISGISALLLMLIPITSAQAISGREVYEKVHALRAKALNRKTEAGMVLFDKGGTTRTRTLVEYSQKFDSEAFKVLVVFDTPADLKNVGFLVHARSFTERDLWAYFPEFRRIRRIPTNSQDDSFFGSDFSYDDFGGPPNLDDYTFKIRGEDVIAGKACHVVEVTPKIRRKYSRYIAWVSKEHFIHLKIEYYQGQEIYRQGLFTDIRIIDEIPTPFKSMMENRKTGHKTDLTIINIQYNTSFQEELFTYRSLERAGK